MNSPLCHAGLPIRWHPFMALMNHVFKLFLDQFVVVFIDNILVYFQSDEKDKEFLRKVLEVSGKVSYLPN